MSRSIRVRFDVTLWDLHTNPAEVADTMLRVLCAELDLPGVSVDSAEVEAT